MRRPMGRAPHRRGRRWPCARRLRRNSQVRDRGGRTAAARGRRSPWRSGPEVCLRPVSEPRRTPLYDLHASSAAAWSTFAGWEMPVQYPAGILAEHQHCRAAAALFDVSHMGQVRLDGADAAAGARAAGARPTSRASPRAARATPSSPTRTGGILDDLIVSNAGDHLFVVVNAGCRDADLAHLRAALEPAIRGHRARRPGAARPAGARGR